MLAQLLSRFAMLIFIGFASTSASAEWYEASSDNFVIYADDSERDIRRFSENLERYHSAMEYITGRQIEKPSPSNRVVIFVVGSGREVRRIAGGNNRNIAGFYVPRAGSSRAFVQTIRNKNGYPDFSTIVLLHEYAHHFLISTSRFAMPRWMSEGAAEFFASAGFNRDGTLLIGRPAVHRGAELAFAEEVNIRELLDYDRISRNRGRRNDSFYGRSWLLYHYLTFTPERRGQLDAYWREVLNGTSQIEAAENTFGDLDVLDRELKAYQRQRRMFTFSLAPDQLQASAVTLRQLPEGEAEMMEVRMRSQRGVNSEQAAELVIEAREIAAEYPNDPGVLTALSETEYDAGNDDAAIAAADAAIAIDPTWANAYVQKGYALFRKAKDAAVPDQAYEAAMTPFSQLNARENDHPLPLIYYYRSFVERGIEPPENAKAALERAAQLAPFDHQLWLNVAIMHAGEGKIELAQQSLQPLAANPHGGRTASAAQNLIDLLERAPEGVPLRINPRTAGSDTGDQSTANTADSDGASENSSTDDESETVVEG